VAVVVVMRLSKTHSWYDYIDERKIHSNNTPRLGGLAFGLVFVLAFTALFIFKTANLSINFPHILVFLSMILILVSGALDDFKPLRSRFKLVLQIIAALLVIISDYTFQKIFVLDLMKFPFISWIRYPVTLFWIVGLTNAMNLIDGIDGLAGGLSVIIALTFALIFIASKDPFFLILTCFCLAAVICGFLVFNLPIPHARIFMGDGGSQFLGFMLAILPLVEQQKRATDIPLFYAAALIAIPIFDTFAAIWRRIRDHHPIDSPDKAHIHHKLPNLGLTVPQINFLLWGIQIVLGVLVYLSITKFKGFFSFSLIILAYLIVTAFFTLIHFLNQRVTRLGVSQPDKMPEAPQDKEIF
jgi:UDP-GlcNAc:undecaprenyl-phosphate GlcNAc-1-phosphate transferase